MNVFLLLQAFGWICLLMMGGIIAAIAIPWLTVIGGYAAGILTRCFLAGFGKGLDL